MTEEQTELLDKDIEEFTEAESESREQIIQDNLTVFKNTWPEHFKRHGPLSMETVCVPLVAFRLLSNISSLSDSTY